MCNHRKLLLLLKSTPSSTKKSSSRNNNSCLLGGYFSYKKLLWIFCVAIIFLTFYFPEECQANPDAKRLYDDLLSNYNRLIRPVSNNNDSILVRLGLRLSQIIDLVSLKYFTYNNIQHA